MRERRSRAPKTVRPAPVMTPALAYEEHSIDQLRVHGFRITMPRVQVIRALADTKTTLSAYAIHEKILAGGGKIDVVSVYRILSTLQDVGLIHHIGVADGYFPCRVEDCTGKRSEVVVFEESGEVLELSIPQTVLDALDEQARKSGFETTGVKVEITANPAKR